MKIVNYEKMKKHFENVVDVKLFTIPNILTIMETFTEDLPDAVARDDIRSGRFLSVSEERAQERRASEQTLTSYMRGWNDALEAAADNGPSVFRFSEVRDEGDRKERTCPFCKTELLLPLSMYRDFHCPYCGANIGGEAE